MQWNGSKNAGFSSASPEDLWLPIMENTDYININVDVCITQAYLSQHMRKWYLSHRRPAKAQASAHKPSLARTFAAGRHVVETLRKLQVKKQNKTKKK